MDVKDFDLIPIQTETKIMIEQKDAPISSLLKDVAEAWLGMQVAKQVTRVGMKLGSRMIAPIAVVGVGYFIYQRYKNFILENETAEATKA